MRHRRFVGFLALALAALAIVSAVAAQQRPPIPPSDPEKALAPARETLAPGENLLLSPPKDWELGFSDRDDDQATYEYLPPGQEIEGWAELLTVQVYFTLGGVPPRALLERMRKGFEEACDNPGAEAPAERAVTGYPAARQLLLCGRNRKGGGKGEVALILAVSGRDALYVVQRAWRGEAFRGAAPASARALLSDWQQFLDKVRICDTRDRTKPCGP